MNRPIESTRLTQEELDNQNHHESTKERKSQSHMSSFIKSTKEFVEEVRVIQHSLLKNKRREDKSHLIEKTRTILQAKIIQKHHTNRTAQNSGLQE